MKRLKIYLRSVGQNGGKHLAMFDSNRNGAIDNLVSEAHSGGTIFWKLDRCSGIKSIIKIYSKSEETIVFKNALKKLWLCKGFKLKLPDVEKEVEEAYFIKYIDWDNTEVRIHPFIKIIPPE